MTLVRITRHTPVINRSICLVFAGKGRNALEEPPPNVIITLPTAEKLDEFIIRDVSIGIPIARACRSAKTDSTEQNEKIPFTAQPAASN
jgi:hypothetical protein